MVGVSVVGGLDQTGRKKRDLKQAPNNTLYDKQHEKKVLVANSMMNTTPRYWSQTV